MRALPGAGHWDSGGEAAYIVASTRRTALLRTRPTKDNTVEEMTPCAQCIYGEARIKWTTSTHSAWYVLNAQALSYIYI